MNYAHERLKQARERAGYETATAAAQAFGWPASTYLGHENGSRGLTKDAASRYAKAFGISWAWLLGDDDELSELTSLLKAIPVKGVIDPGAYRAADFHILGMPKEIYVQVFGYEPEEIEAYQLYGSRDDHFLLVAPKGNPTLRMRDELVVRRTSSDKYEIACWRLVKGPSGAELEIAYSSHVHMERESFDILNEDVELLGVVIGELRIKRRAEETSTPFDD